MRVRMLTILLDRQVYKGTRILLLSVEKDKLVLTPVENYVVQDFGASFTNGGNQEAGWSSDVTTVEVLSDEIAT